MGGGAGIVFELTMSSGGCVYSRGRLSKVDWKVESFDAHGYMDGWSGINGKYLKVKSLELHLDRDDADWAKKNLSNGDWLSIYAHDQRPKFILFSGYVRGDYRKCFPLDVECYPYVGQLGQVKATLVVEPAKGFQGMYKDVFENWAYHGSRWTGRKWEGVNA